MGKSSFKVLGIIFNIDLEKMFKVNYASKIQQVEKGIKQWEKRSLSPIGKITVIKTLLLPIFNKLLLSLPNPKNTILNRGSYMSAHVLLNLLNELGKKR